MRIGGVEAKGLNEEILVLPRSTGDLVFKARAIPDYEEFNRVVPDPTPPVILTKDGKKDDENDMDYLAAQARKEMLRIAYILLKSLEPSNIEWDTVDMARPNTWTNYKDDLKAAGICANEMNRIWALCSDANALSEDKLAAARNRFLHGQAQALAKSSSLTTEQGISQSGEPANASA